MKYELGEKDDVRSENDVKAMVKYVQGIKTVEKGR